MHLQPFQRLYGNLYCQRVQLWAGECDSRIVNMVHLMMGIFGARSVQTGRMAAHVPVVAKKMSIVRHWVAPAIYLLRKMCEGDIQSILDLG